MLETCFSPFPTLTTDRLVLRQLEISDDKDIFAHRSDDTVNTHLENFRHSSIEQTQAFIERVLNEISSGKTILWVISEKGNNRFIGTVCLWNISREECKAETGYTLDPAFHKMGYMNEALSKVISFGFNKILLRTIEAYTHKDNQASVKLLLRNNFKQEIARKKEAGTDRIFFTLTL